MVCCKYCVGYFKMNVLSKSILKFNNFNENKEIPLSSMNHRFLSLFKQNF